jgi:hypothetical protein
MATLIQVFDGQELKTVKTIEVEDSLPEKEAAAIAACRMNYPPHRYDIRALHGPSIQAIKDAHNIG